MRTDRRHLLVAVAASVAAHAGLVAVSLHLGTTITPASPRAATVSAAEPIVVPLPPPRELPDPARVWGEASGAGEGLNSADAPAGGQVAPQQQAATTPDPAEAFRPSRRTFEPADAPARPAVERPAAAAAPPAFAGRLPPSAVRERAPAAAEEPAEPTPPSPPSPPTPPTAARGESAVDAASTDVTLRLTGGGEAREGRRFKLADFDRFLHQGEQTAFSKLPVVIVTRVTLDESGNVLDVEFIKPSPSESFDHALRLMLFGSWFEPVDGANVFTFTAIFS